MEKVAIITGGTRGIGLGIARILITDNWRLVLNGIRHENEVIDDINDLTRDGASVIYVRGDIGTESGRRSVMETALKAFGSINALVNNAGVSPVTRSDLLQLSETSYDRVMNINLKGPFFLTQMICRYFVSEKTRDPEFQATIINVTSISSTVVSINRGEYCISKAGLSMASQLFAARMGDIGIPVYEVRPGVIQTDMTYGVKEKYDELFQRGLAIQGRWGQPADVGKAVKSLLDRDFPYSTGTVFMVDGGLTVPRL